MQMWIAFDSNLSKHIDTSIRVEHNSTDGWEPAREIDSEYLCSNVDGNRGFNGLNITEQVSIEHNAGGDIVAQHDMIGRQICGFELSNN